MKRRDLLKDLILLLFIPECLSRLFKKKEKKIIYDDWNDIVIAQWGGFDIIQSNTNEINRFINDMKICTNCNAPMVEVTTKNSKHYHFICSECGSETLVNKNDDFPGDLIDEIHSYT